MPTIAMYSRILVPNNTTQATNDTSGSGGGGHDGLPPQYISLLALFAGFFIISALAIIAATRTASPNRPDVEDNAELNRHRQLDNPNNLFQFSAFRPQGPRSGPYDARASLNAVSPAIPFGKLQSQGDDHKDKDIEADTDNKNNTKTKNDSKRPTPPDQTGTTVVCIICLDDFNPQSAVRVLLCGHIFHAVCIDEWLLAKHHCACPICGSSYLPDAMGLPAEPRPTHLATSTGVGNRWAAESPPFVDVPLR